MTDRSKTVSVKDVGNLRPRVDAVLKNSILFGYVDTRSANAVKDRSTAFELAAETFRNEITSALTVKPVGEETDSARYELIKPFIIKLLLYLGKIPNDSSFVIAARLIEARVVRPDMNIGDAIKELSDSIGSTLPTVKRIAENCFDCYDESVVERISYLTGTRPFTSLEAICDLAIYIRLKMCSEITYE